MSSAFVNEFIFEATLFGLNRFCFFELKPPEPSSGLIVLSSLLTIFLIRFSALFYLD